MTRFGFRTGSFRGWTVKRAMAELARLGYDCVELCLEPADVRPGQLDKPRCGAIRRMLDDLGLGLASASYHADGEPPAQRAANQERAVRVAHWLGADCLVINAEKSVDPPRQWAEHVERLRRLARLGEELGVTLAVEPEPLLVIGSSQDALTMIEAVGSPRLRVNLDIGHARITDDDLPASIRRLGAAIAHLHLEDIKGRVHRHLLFGEGDIDMAAVRQALADVGYRGPYVVDLFGLEDPSAAAARALEGLRRLFG